MVAFTGVLQKSTETGNIMVSMVVVARHAPKDVGRIVIVQEDNLVMDITIIATRHVYRIRA